MAEKWPGHAPAPRDALGPQMSGNTLASAGTPRHAGEQQADGQARCTRTCLVRRPSASMCPTRGAVSGRKRAEWAARGLEGASGIPSLVPRLFLSIYQPSPVTELLWVRPGPHWAQTQRPIPALEVPAAPSWEAAGWVWQGGPDGWVLLAR